MDSNDIAFVFLILCLALLVAYALEPRFHRPR